MPSRRLGERAAVGSSSSSTRGSSISARAIASACRCPPERCEARAPERSSSSGNIRSTSASRCGASPRRWNPPISRFSRIVSDGNTFSVCGTNDAPSRTIREGASSVTSRPSSSTRPSPTGSSPKIAFSSVDLPAPFGPMIVTSSPRSRRSDTSCTIITSP